MKALMGLKPKAKPTKFQLGLFIVVFAIIGGIILLISHAAPNPNLPGDLNNDNTVNGLDLSLLLGAWGTNNTNDDINGDGTVNGLDLSILLGHWGQSIQAAIPKHIETWAYDLPGTSAEGSTASGALVRQWLTYAEGGNINSSKAVNDCHGGTPACKAMAYEDANLIYPLASDAFVVNAASENWWLHIPGYTDSAHRLNYKIGSYAWVYHLNDNIAAVDSFWKNYDDSGLAYDGLFMDDSAATLKDTLYQSGYSSSQEETSDAQVQAGHEALSSALTKSDGSPFIQVNNGVAGQPYLNAMAGINQTLNSKNVIGSITEDEPIQNGSMMPQLYYGSLLDVVGYMIHTSKFHVLLSSSATTTDPFRRVTEGTMLLGYLPGKLVDWNNLEDKSTDLAVFPEEGIYPTQPLQTMSTPSGSGCLTGSGNLCNAGGHNDVQVAPGVYRREFAACYNQGVLFGKCATIVNSTTSAVTVQSAWLSQSYAHEITFNGGDVQNGGTVNLSGAGFTKGTSTVAAQDAILLTP